MNMKKLIYLLIFISLTSCKEKPNYNPFDNQFNISIKSLTKDDCDTISAGCGYFNLTQKNEKLKTYYQVYLEDFNKVVAKGFSYALDTFQLNIPNGVVDNKPLVDSIMTLPIDREQSNEEFGRHGYKIHSRNGRSFLITNIEILDTIKLEMKHNLVLDSQHLIRYFDYFNESAAGLTY